MYHRWRSNNVWPNSCTTSKWFWFKCRQILIFCTQALDFTFFHMSHRNNCSNNPLLCDKSSNYTLYRSQKVIQKSCEKTRAVMQTAKVSWECKIYINYVNAWLRNRLFCCEMMSLAVQFYIVQTSALKMKLNCTNMLYKRCYTRRTPPWCNCFSTFSIVRLCPNMNPSVSPQRMEDTRHALLTYQASNCPLGLIGWV